MRINMSDIAKEANVSTATVSRVISGKPGVGKETIKKVESIIESKGYRPSVSARVLAQKRTGNIAIVNSRGSEIIFGNPFFSNILDGVSKVLDQKDYNMIPSFTLSQQQKLIKTDSVDGILLFAVREGDPLIEWLKDIDIPTVVVGSYRNDSPYPSVRPHDELGIYEGVNHLIKCGHKDIKLVNGPLSSIKSVRCKEGFSKAMEENGLSCTSASIVEVQEYDMNESFKALDKMFRKKNESVTGIICSSDYLALGVMKAAKKNGVKVPDDLSLIGFGNIPITDFTHPALTTMHTDLHGIGNRAGQMLSSLIEGKKIRKKERVFPLELIERESVKKLN